MTDADDEMPKTEDLVRAFQQGAELSFDALYERLAPALYAWTVLRAPRGIEPGDVLAETWLRAVRSVHEFDPGRASFRTWLFGIAKKVLLYELRARARRRALTERPDADSRTAGLERIPEAVTSLSVRLGREESMARFLERINAFAREERELVLYCGLEGSSCREAATRMGLSEQAMLKRWQRLRAELRESSWAAQFLE